MFELSIERRFSAAHAIVINGERETVHGHDWRVTVIVGGADVDDEGLLCDFHELEHALDRIVGPFRNQDLNATPPFDELNPTAENVARYVGESMAAGLPTNIELRRVSVEEAPRCVASWCP
ncbi:MAG: 6-pyruvoyl trahydropterin synthase family protein [Planctomycetota bacterium]|jgi:6-pyruvoyltetrahydropterin/6-carboxytetrahydropterin synthase